MTKRRIIKWLAALGGLCIILVLGLALLLPRLLDSQAVRDKIRSYLLTKTNGNVVIGNIDLTWLPWPTIIVRGASFDFADNVSGKIQSIEVQPSILGLLRGSLDVSEVKVTSPALAVHLPEPAEEPLNLDELEGQIRSLIASLTAEIPGMVVTVRGGSVEVKVGNRPPVVISELDGRLVAPPDAMALRFSSRANVFDSLTIEESIAGDTLVTKGRIKIDGLRLRESLASLLPRSDEYFESGSVSLDVTLTSVGLKQIKAEVEGSLPSLGLVRENRKTVIEGIKFKGAISRDEGLVSAVIERLDLVSPRLTVSGELTVDPASSSQLKLVGKDLDVSQVRESALQIAGEVEVIEDIFRHIKSGKMPEIRFQADGGTFAEMRKNIEVTGTLHDGSLFASDLNLDLNNVDGQFAVSHGILEAKQLSVRHDKIQGREGTLRLGLEGKSPPFHLDMMIETDAAELRSLLFRVIKDDGFRQQLTRLHDVTGDLSGRLILGDRTDSLSAIVSILKMAISGSYEPIPYPIAIKEGRLQYNEGKIALENMSGAVGLSSFSGLTGSLSYNESRQIEISSGKFSLDLAQTKELQNRFAKFPRVFGDIEFARGRLDLTSLSLKGPLDEPSRWNFTSTGTLDNIAVKHAKLPAVINLSGGRFSGTPTTLTFSDAKFNLLDASLTVDGSLDTPGEAPLSLEATGAGNIGAEMTGWLSRQIELPKELMLRSPLQMTKGRVVWKQGDDVAFRGNITVAGGPRLSLDMVKGSQILAVKEILVTDGEQSARMTLDLKKDNFVFSFNGALYQETLNRIFQVSPLEGSLIQGDIEVSVYDETPLRFSARGRLSGRGLRVPLKDESAIVEFFFLEADPDAVNLRSANLRWSNSRFSFMGKLLAATKALRFDLDISADRVIWEEISAMVDGGGNRKGDEGILGIALPPLEGTVRIKADHFTFAGYSSNPLQGTASLSPDGIKGHVERGEVCGIGTTGNLNFVDGEVGLDLSLSATDGQLESSSLCLTKNRHAISGSYSLQAHVAGKGAPENMLRTLTGAFEFSARGGQFVQSPTVDSALEAAFDYLNEKKDVNVDFPDLDKESAPFQSISAKGTVEGETLVSDELIIQSTLFIISGRGRIDLEHKQIDATALITARLPGNRITRRIPLIGSFLGSSIVGIPVRITGSLEQPNVTYLSPSAVGAELLDIPRKILGLPLEAIRLFTPTMRRPESQ
ncbi:MAG TPA: AsmA-like C-terminal region-containing protein [Candidatus Binatia bacterium]|nr:AsmA-like C-terminal region-containing protein [Candidatus Binatia bacterium]